MIEAMPPTRRQLLKYGIGAGAVVGLGTLGRVLLIPPSPSASLASTAELAIQLVDALDEDERTEAYLPYDHPLRQYHNRGVDTGGLWSIRLNAKARQILVDLVHAGLSEIGRERVLNQFFVNLPGIHVTRLAICGDPRTPFCQILVTGPHLNLRLGGTNREGVAFGGPQVYGDQRGNEKIGLPGNVYRYQLEAGQRLFAGLTPAERQLARQPKAPVQTAIEVQGRAGRFHGVPVAEISTESRQRVRQWISGILENYAEADAADAWQCIEANGGVEAMHLADYAEDHQPGRNVGNGISQIFRLEGPAAVFHYRGEPHLHALFNVAMNGERPLSVGEVIGENPVALDRADVKALFEEVLLAETGADLAYYHAESVAGILRAGTIRTGDLYNLESWREDVTVVDIKGADLSETLRTAFRAGGESPNRNSTYRVATTSYITGNLAEEFLGSIDSEETGPMLRDVAIAHLSKYGFDASS
jgi:hypothetical protein